MRVGLFSESYEPVQNGVAISVRTLADELRGRRHRVYIVAPHYPDHTDSIPFVLRVPSMLTPLNPSYALPFPWFPRLRREFKRLAPDVLHSHTPFFLGLLAARLSRRDDIPLVSTYHTLYNHYGHYLFFLPPPSIENLLDWWIPEYYNRCVDVIVPSQVAEDSLRHYGVTVPITIIPTGVPIPPAEHLEEEARLRARQRWDIPPDSPMLLYVGRLAREKNIELTLDSFARVAPQFPEARLLVIGSGPHEDACRAYAESLPCGDRVIFAGMVPRHELDPVYAAADLFVFGSSTETQGLVIAEARAAGTPCVVVNEGGAGETVQDGEDGLVVESNVEAFSEAIHTLLSDSFRRRKMMEACLRNACRYTPSAMTDRVIYVYQHAIETRQREKADSNSRQ
jgi:glycosyltransferase involved in cell wall biosynthesis